MGGITKYPESQAVIVIFCWYFPLAIVSMFPISTISKSFVKVSSKIGHKKSLTPS
jgi:hypothetical protein